MKAEVAGFWVVAVLLGCALVPPLAGQEAADTAAAQQMDRPLGWLWTGIGLTDVRGDADAPGSLAELGVEWMPWHLLAVGVALGSAGIEEEGTCERGGFVFQCRQFETIFSASLGTRIYAYQNRLYSAYGLAQVGIQSDDLGGFREIGVGLLFKTVGEFSVGIETRRRFGWPEFLADGSFYLFRVARGLGGASRSGSGSE